jgi:hypothetical protein
MPLGYYQNSFLNSLPVVIKKLIGNKLLLLLSKTVENGKVEGND